MHGYLWSGERPLSMQLIAVDQEPAEAPFFERYLQIQKFRAETLNLIRKSRIKSSSLAICLPPHLSSVPAF